MLNPVEVFHLYKKYRNKVAVEDISFVVRKSELFGLLGPNGAGKSTTLKSICGLIKPTAGTVFIDGINIVENPKEAKKKIGYLPEERNLYEYMRVNEYLKFFGSLYGIKGRKLDESVEKSLLMVDMLEEKETTIETLSKGMKQRVSIARAIVHNPKILILDEPTSGLDPKSARETRDLISKLKDEGKTVILSTHNMLEAEELCDKIAMVANGRILKIGGVKEIKEIFRHGKTKVVLKEEKDIDRVREIFGNIEINGKEVIIDLPIKDVLSKIERFEISEVREIGRSLEDIFIELIGGKDGYNKNS